MVITTVPVVFGSKSCDLGGFVEIINSRAVDRTLREKADVLALQNHNSDHVLARTGNKTLALVKTSHGLRADIDLNPDVSYAADLIAIHKRGDVPGGSFAFRALDDLWTLDKSGLMLREVLDMAVSEVSVFVAFPAYSATQQPIRTGSAMSVEYAKRVLRQSVSR